MNLTAQRYERLIFGLIIIVGYFTIGGIAVLAPDHLIGDEDRTLTRDVLLTVGPLLGMIVKAIWEEKSNTSRTEIINTSDNPVPVEEGEAE